MKPRYEDYSQKESDKDMRERQSSSKSNAWLPVIATAGLGIAAYLLARRLGSQGKSLGQGVNDILDTCQSALNNLESRIQGNDTSAVA